MKRLLGLLALDARGNGIHGTRWTTNSIFTDMAIANVLDHAIQHAEKINAGQEAFDILYHALKKFVREN